MDVAIALVLTAAGAFVFLDSCQLTAYRTVREEGNRLYFRTAAAGAILFGVAFGLRFFALEVAPFERFDSAVRGWITPLLKDPNSASAQAAAIITAVLAFLLGLVLPPLLNLVPIRSWILWRAIKDDDLEALLYRAAVGAKPVMVTLTNTKVYVGFVIRTFDPRRDRKMFTMMPLVSGYRTAAGKVEFTTFYDVIYSQLARSNLSGGVEGAGELAGVTFDDFRLVLPVDKALAVTLFDLRVYDHFQRGRESEV